MVLIMKNIKLLRFEVRRDRNGNKIATVRPCTNTKRFRAFNIQTLGSLPKCHKLELGTIIETNTQVEYWKEILVYIKAFGTKKQKSLFCLDSI